MTDLARAGAGLHVHIENDGRGPAALRLAPGRLEDRLARAGLAGAVSRITENGEPARMAEAIAGADVLFAARKLAITTAQRAAPGLRWVQVISAGVDALVAEWPPDVVLTNASGVHGEKGGEYALAAALMLVYGIPGFASDKVEARWRPAFGGPARGRRVLLLGVGGIGRAAAPLLRRHGMAVTGLTRGGRSDADLDRVVGPRDLDAALPETDILVSTLPLTPDTRGLVDRRRLALLPSGAGVVVLGRADVFDYDALADALDAGRLGGAVLDVFPQEPLAADHRLWRTPRLVMTPHCSVDDHDTYVERCLDIFVDNLGRFGRGEPLNNVVDRALGY